MKDLTFFRAQLVTFDHHSQKDAHMGDMWYINVWTLCMSVEISGAFQLIAQHMSTFFCNQLIGL